MSNEEVVFWVVFILVLGGPIVVIALGSSLAIGSVIWSILTGPFRLISVVRERRRIDRILGEASDDDEP